MWYANVTPLLADGRVMAVGHSDTSVEIYTP
ncbi:uncharacterized protein SOCE26_078200 [Sorangium cellulosum]|uniref:Uncharacterized protein n=1 Tax=Sorangium cellulosum TaxID=56 RepID=A0A2L0F418_SORCE|nr:uncharacterized protein SOCE26_078200 [Sorangium cellulosum]